MTKTHYDVLGVPANADDEAIKAAYRRVLKAYHPDLNAGAADAERRSKQIIAAYGILKDRERRVRYDQFLRNRQRRFRQFAFTALVSMGLVSSTSLLLMYLLLNPGPRAPDPAAPALQRQAAAPSEPAPQIVPEPTGPKLAVDDTITGSLPDPEGDPAPQQAAMVSVMTAPAAAEPDEAAGEPAPDTLDRDRGAMLASLDPGSALPRGLTELASGGQAMGISTADVPATVDIGTVQSHLTSAAISIARGDLDKALADYDAALQIDDTNAAAFHGRGVLLWRRGEVERALADLDRAIRSSFSNAKIYAHRGLIWSSRGNYDRAIADYNQAIKLDPNFAGAYSYRGVAQRLKGDFRNAIADFDQAIGLNPGLAEAHRNRELARTGRNEPD